MHTSYRARLVVVGEAGALPFKNDGIDAADDAEAWDKACAWYESIRPSGYLPRELVLTKQTRKFEKTSSSLCRLRVARLRAFIALAACLCSPRSFALLRSGRRLVDQPPQGQAHRVVEIAIDKATAAELQPSNDTFKKDAALFRR
jgi:hypothetical protein